MSRRRTEWVMHVWGRKREELTLNSIEKYHIDLIRKYSDEQKKFDRILVNIALDDINDMELFNFLKKEIGNSLVCGDVEFRYCQNDPRKCEYVTFRPYVFDRMGDDVDIFYSHFKGSHTFVNIFRSSFPERVIELSEMFWTYCMYHESLDVDAAKKALDDKAVYCWFYLKNSSKSGKEYIDNVKNIILGNYPGVQKDISKDGYNYSPGSFCWYNMNVLADVFKDKRDALAVTDEGLLAGCSGIMNPCTHFCEIYHQMFIDDEYVASVNDFSDVWNRMSLAYVYIYPQKMICRYLLDEFDEYVIKNGVL